MQQITQKSVTDESKKIKNAFLEKIQNLRRKNKKCFEKFGQIILPDWHFIFSA
jgi:hypothetical protein